MGTKNFQEWAQVYLEMALPASTKENQPSDQHELIKESYVAMTEAPMTDCTARYSSI